jgi:hypothetical protein
MTVLADVKLPQSQTEKSVEIQAKRIRSLANDFTDSDSAALVSLGELLSDIADELDNIIEGDNCDATVAEEIEKAIKVAKTV